MLNDFFKTDSAVHANHWIAAIVKFCRRGLPWLGLYYVAVIGLALEPHNAQIIPVLAGLPLGLLLAAELFIGSTLLVLYISWLRANHLWSGLISACYAIFAFFGAQIIAAIVLLTIYAGLKGANSAQALDWLSGGVTGQFIYVLLVDSLILAGLYSYTSIFKISLQALGLRKPRLGDIGNGLLYVVPYFVLLAIVLAVAGMAIPGLDVNQKQELGFDNVQGTIPLLLTFLSLVVLAPLVEEILVRGFLYGSLKRSLPVIAAALITSGFFAAAHLPEGGAAGPLYVAGIDTFILSLILIRLREKTGGLWAGMTLHAVKNGLAFFFLFIAPLLHFAPLPV